MSNSKLKSWLTKPTSVFKPSAPDITDSQTQAIKNLASLFVVCLGRDNPDLKAVLDVLVRLEAAKLAQDKPLERVVAAISGLTPAAIQDRKLSQSSASAALQQVHASLSELVNNNRELVESEVDEMVSKWEAICPGILTSAGTPKSARWRNGLLACLAASSTTLGILKEASEGVPLLKPIAGGLAGLMTALHNTGLNSNGMRDLLDAIGRSILVIARQCSDPRVKSTTLEGLMGDLDRDLQDIVVDCNKLKQKSVIRKILENKNYENALAGFNEAFDRAVDRFTTSVTLRMYGAVNDVDAKTDLILLGQHLPTHPTIPRRLDDYHPGSRDAELDLVQAWLNDPNGELILWMHGAAGIGKSTLAQRLCQDLRAANQLAAEVVLGVFLGANRDKTPVDVIKVISNTIGNSRLPARRTIADAIQSETGLSTELPQLLEQCILDPLRAGSMEDARVSSPVVVVIDALDEWPAYLQLIAALEHLNPHSATVRFVVLGRHAPPLAPHDAAKARISAYFLGGVKTDIVKEYLAARLQRIPVPVGGIALGQTEADALARMADGVFIWASAALSLIGHEYASKAPRQIYEDIITSRETVGTGETQLHVLYRRGMELLFPDPRQRDLLCRYVRLVSVLQEPIPLADGVQLLRVPTVAGLENIRTKLAAFYIRQQLDVSSLQPAGALFHRSFNEYLKEWGSEYVAHEMVACACLEALAKSVRATVPPYIIQYWPHHAALGSPLVTPASDDDWKASLVCGALHTVSLDAVHQWAAQFWKIVTGDDWNVQLDNLEDLMEELACNLDNKDRKIRGYAISCLEIAVRLRPGDYTIWSKLGWAMWHQHRHTGVPGAIARAVVAHHCAKEAGIGEAEGSQGTLLLALATALGEQADQSGKAEDFFQAIKIHRQALELHPPGHPDRSASLNNLAASLRSHFNNQGDISCLTEAIGLHRQALELRPPGHPDRSQSLNNLANSLKFHFELQGDFSCLTEAIGLHRQALELLPPGHPDRSRSLNNLASSLASHFEVQGDFSCLTEAIGLHRQALELRPPGHPDRSRSLNNLATSLQSHFKAQGDFSCLTEAIGLQRQALELHPPGHPDRSASLNNLATSLKSHFEVQGDFSCLTEATGLHRQALELRPPGHPDRSHSLNNLANSLQSHFKVQGDFSCLTEAIGLHRQALELRPPGHPARSGSLNNLATSLTAHFQAQGDFSCLTEAIGLHRQALELRPPGHPDRTGSLNNLANSLQSHFEVRGDFSCLTEAIGLYRQALELRPPGHPDRSASLNNLAYGLQSQFEVQGDLSHLRETIRLLQEALDALPTEHPNHKIILSNLNRALKLKFKHDGAS